MKNKKSLVRFLVCQLVELAGREYFEVVYMTDLESVYLIPVDVFEPSKKSYNYSGYKVGKSLLAYLL